MDLISLGIYLYAQMFYNFCVGYTILGSIKALDNVIMAVQYWVLILPYNEVFICASISINHLANLLWIFFLWEDYLRILQSPVLHDLLLTYLSHNSVLIEWGVFWWLLSDYVLIIILMDLIVARYIPRQISLYVLSLNIPRHSSKAFLKYYILAFSN